MDWSDTRMFAARRFHVDSRHSDGKILGGGCGRSKGVVAAALKHGYAETSFTTSLHNHFAWHSREGLRLRVHNSAIVPIWGRREESTPQIPKSNVNYIAAPLQRFQVRKGKEGLGRGRACNFCLSLHDMASPVEAVDRLLGLNAQGKRTAKLLSQAKQKTFPRR